MRLFLIIALIITILFAILAIQNPGLITIQFIKWRFSGSMAFILGVAFLSGVIAGIFMVIPAFWRRSRMGRAQKKKIQELEKELVSSTEQKVQTTDHRL